MKKLKFLLLLSLGLFLSVGSLQAQAKKSCSQPCTKVKTAQMNDLQEATPIKVVSQNSAEQGVKNCDPKNCNPRNCNPKNCPPGCDISKCLKGNKNSSAALLKVADQPKPTKVSTKQVALY